MTETAGASAVLAKLGNMSFQPADAEDAWRRIFAFFEVHLA
jgi:dienelactone hydrolase